jgi:uncharacterized protein YjiS (DUF1127 family)
MRIPQAKEGRCVRHTEYDVTPEPAGCGVCLENSAATMKRPATIVFRLLRDGARTLLLPLRAGIATLKWKQRSQQRETLDRLSDHMLRDIGISRIAGDRRSGKPFRHE